MTATAVEARLLSRRFGSRWALRDCSLELPTGAVIGLVGPNGAGKTTLLHLTVGALSPTAGTICVFGRPVTDRPEALANIGFVAQDKPLYRRFTVDEMLRFGASTNRRWEDTASRKRLTDLGIPMKQQIGHLSGGQRAQVALAVALGKQPKLLVLDEPAASLDPLARREFFQTLMEQVASRELTVLLSSHLLDDMNRSCDYVVLLSASRVQLSGPTDELLSVHKAISGPAERLQQLTGQGHSIVRRESSGRIGHALIRSTAPILDPAWTVRDVTLEELVLAYMAEPDTAATDRPTLAAVST